MKVEGDAAELHALLAQLPTAKASKGVLTQTIATSDPAEVIEGLRKLSKAVRAEKKSERI